MVVFGFFKWSLTAIPASVVISGLVWTAFLGVGKVLCDCLKTLKGLLWSPLVSLPALLMWN